MRIGVPSIALVFAVSAFAACSAATPNSGFDNPNGGGGDGGSGGGDDGGFGDDVGSIGTGGDGGAMQTCSPNAANYDIPGNNCDDDGDGKVDNAFVCDANLPLTGAAALFAQAIGLCQTASGPSDSKWGVISATYTNGHTATSAPADAQHGILPKFGSVVVPREGSMFGVLSSGSARETDSDTGPAFKGQKNGMQGLPGAGATPPPGFPKSTSGCPSLGNATFDLINVKLVVKAPANAKGLKFDFDFYSGEWPEFVCTTFNDAFIAYLSAKGFNNGTADNMSFDMNNNPVSVNNGFFDRCTPNTQTGCAGGKKKTAACPGGVGELAGTGFDDPGVYCQTNSTGGGATGWLTSQAPIQPGEVFTIEFMIWDTGDESYDSSVLVDNFQWIPGDTMTGTTRPPK